MIPDHERAIRLAEISIQAEREKKRRETEHRIQNPRRTMTLAESNAPVCCLDCKAVLFDPKSGFMPAPQPCMKVAPARTCGWQGFECKEPLLTTPTDVPYPQPFSGTRKVWLCANHAALVAATLEACTAADAWLTKTAALIAAHERQS